MRLLISNSMPTWGGGENWSLTAAAGLASRGHEVTLLCRPYGELRERAAGVPGIAVEELEISWDIDPRAVLGALRVLRSRSVQAACCNLDREVRTLGVAARLAGVPLARRRGSDCALKNSLRYRLTYRHLVSRIIVNSLATRSSILRANSWLDPSRLHLVYNGIDTSRFRPDPESGEAFRRAAGLGDGLLVGLVGSIFPRKRHETLLRACGELRRADFRLVFAGPRAGEAHASSLEELAASLGLSDRIVWTGQVDDLRGCYNALDVVCLPSDNEGFGYAAAEAMACARAVVVSDASSLPEVAGADGALVFPAGDHAALASVLERLLEGHALREDLGLAGRRRIESAFSMDRMLDALESFFRGLAGVSV
jgi:glycosyltransferase involved in cell wall biosynthesis